MNKGQKKNRSYTQVKRIRVKEGSKTNVRPEKMIKFRDHPPIYPSIHTTHPIHRNPSCHTTKGNPRQAASLAQGYQIDTDNYSHLLPIYNHQLTEHACLWAVEGSCTTCKLHTEKPQQAGRFQPKMTKARRKTRLLWCNCEGRSGYYKVQGRVNAGWKTLGSFYILKTNQKTKAKYHQKK